MNQIGLRFVKPSLSKRGDELVFDYTVKGGEEKHQLLLEKLISDKNVLHFDSIDPN